MEKSDNAHAESPMNRTTSGPAFWGYSAAALMVLIFLGDLLTPLGFAHGTLYTLPVMLAALSRSSRLTVSLAAICSVLTLAAIPLAPPGDVMSVVLANRCISILVIASLTLLINFALKTLTRSQQTQQRFEDSLHQLEQQDALLSLASELGGLGGWSLRLPAPGKMRQGRTLAELRWSPQVARIHGLEPGFQPQLHEALSYYTRESAPLIQRALRACIEQGQPYDIELQIVDARQQPVWVRAIAKPVLNEDGKVTEIHGAFQDLTSEKEKDQLLSESDQRFHRLADALPVIIWTALPDGTLDFANQALTNYTGVCATELLPAQRWINSIHPDDIDLCIQRWQEAAASETPYEAEFRLRDKNDDMRWHLVSAKPVRNQEGRVQRWYGTAVDIHDRRLLQTRTQELAERYNNTLESISDGLYVLDTEWRFTYINKKAETLLQRKRHQLLGRIFWERFTETALLREHFEQAVASQQQQDFRYFDKVLHLWLQVHAYPSTAGVTVYFYDISTDVAMQQALQESEERFRIVARATTDAVWDWDARTEAMWWNDGFFQLFGFKRNDVVLSADFWASRIHPDDRREVVKSILATIRGHEEEWRAEYRFIRHDESVAWVSDRGYVIRDTEGNALRMVGGMTDITQRKSMALQLQQSERLRAIGELTGGVAHDFNNLLTIILGNTQTLTEILEDPQALSLAEMTHNAATRSAQLTQRLVAFARQQPLQPSSINIRQLLNEMEALLRRTLPTGIDFELIHAGGLWHAMVDPSQLENAILNLCLNARDAMAESGKLTIESANTHLDADYCHLHPDVSPGQYVMIAVSDTGCGIPAELTDRIFDPFYTTRKKGRGAGLGLSMVYGFIKQSNGHIKVYSEPGHGTTMKMYLPRSLEKQEIFPGTVSNPVRGGNEKILLVEDDEMVREFTETTLAELGYQILSADNYSSALHLLEQHQDVALLFTDVVLGGDLNGRQLAEAACALRPELKVLYMSGYTENAIVHHGRLDAGIQLLSKPYRRRELATRLRQLLDQ